MPKKLTWDDAEDLGIELSEAHPDLDPLTVRFTDLHRYVTELPISVTIRSPQTKANWKPSRWHGTKSTRTAPKPSHSNS